MTDNLTPDSSVAPGTQEPVGKPKVRVTPVAVAAVASLLLAGTVLVLNRDGNGLPPDPVGSASRDADLTRCYAAIEQAGKTSLFPGRSLWRTVLTTGSTPYSDLTVMAVTGSVGDPFFCETTATTVTVSDPTAPPHYAAGSRTAALLMSRNGVVAGVIDSSWPAARIALPPNTQSLQGTPDGIFVYESQFALTASTQVKVEEAAADLRDFPSTPPALDLPHPAAPAVSVVDQPSLPQDRTSAQGKALGECLARADARQPVVDIDSYGPGAVTSSDGATLLVARSPNRLGACVRTPVPGGLPDVVRFAPGFRPSAVASKHVPVAYYPGSLSVAGQARATLAGTVPSSTARMTIRFGNGTTVAPDIVNGTFGLIIPETVTVNGTGIVDEQETTTRLFGPDGRVFYEGSMDFWQAD
jgi:hypothetical protein